MRKITLFLIIFHLTLLMGAQDLHIDGTGYIKDNVGIGALNPIDKLEVHGGLTVDGSGGLSVIRMRQNDSLRWTFLTAPWIGNNDLRIRNEGFGDIMTFDRETGKVGIGTTTPNEIIEISLGAGSGSIASFSAINNPRLLISVDGVDSDLSSQSGNNLKLGTSFSGTSLTVLNSNGNVGIGSTDPQSELHVVGDHLRLSAISDVDKYIQFRTDGTNLDLDTNGGNLYLNSGVTLAMGLGATKVGVGTDAPEQKLDVNGNARFRLIGSGTSLGALHYDNDGNLTTDTSDKRLKNNIENIENSLDMISRLSGRYYTWKDKPNQGRMIGLIAQEVENIVPELVFTNPVDGFKGVHYEKTVALLIEGMKEQQSKINELSKEITELKNLLKTRSGQNVGED